MKFNHLSFPSNDVKATAGFFIEQLSCSLEFDSPAAVMLKRGGFDLVIEAKEQGVAWPHNFHLGLELGSVDELLQLYKRFKEQASS